MSECIFCKIRDKKIPSKIIYEDEEIIAFPDIHPVKKIHILIVPKKHTDDFLLLGDDRILNGIRKAIQTLIKSSNLDHSGYRIVINGGGAQIVDHLHVHLMGPMGKAASL